MRTLLLTLTCLMLAAGAPVHALSSFSAEYQISRGVLKLGVMERRLTIQPDHQYVFESRMRTKGLVSLFSNQVVTEISQGKVVDGRFRADTFAYTKGDKKKDYTIRFDYANNTVANPAGKYAWHDAMPSLTLDKLNYQAQIMLDVPGMPATLDYAIADRKRLKQYVIEHLGEEVIETRVGRFNTVKLRRAQPDSKKQTIVWCARELAWLPVKVEYRDKDGDLTTALLSALPQPPTADTQAATTD